MPEFTHIDPQGHVQMVDVTGKAATLRDAVAQAVVYTNADTFDRIRRMGIQKGNVLETSRIAGIMAAKKTAEFIPMCHPLNISHVAVDFFPDASSNAIRIEVTVRTTGPTGVEMEALSAASVSALTIYDMCKSHDREMRITDICLLRKSGGKSGTFTRKENAREEDFFDKG